MHYRRPTVDDLEAMATVATAAQGDPSTHCVYLPADSESIVADVIGLDGWTATTTVAVDDDGRVCGWLLAEPDPDMGRVWWWGPFVTSGAGAGPDPARWAATADELHAATEATLVADGPGAITEFEGCGDDRSTLIADWCRRHGMVGEEASVLLRLHPDAAGDAVATTGPDPRVRPLTEADHEVVMALHETAFANTHLTPAALVAAADLRLVIEVDGAVVGYVACEHQSDSSGYIDYLAVDGARQNEGLGRALVDVATRRLLADGADFVHLTVREGNAAARALYANCGFVEERLARPFRRGFSLP
ncbi:MAG: GNAT family N-acetyltransferase [Actinomycetota bacterium]